MNAIEKEIQRIATVFSRKHPEFYFGVNPDGSTNMSRLQEWMNRPENSLPVTVENLSFAYEVLKAQGQTFTAPTPQTTPTSTVGTADEEGFTITGVPEIDAIRTPADIKAMKTDRFIWLRKKYGITFNKRIGEVDAIKNNNINHPWHSRWGNS